MQLQLHAHVQSARRDPVGELLQVDLVPGRRDQDGVSAGLQVVICNHLFRVVPVAFIRDYELHFVAIDAQAFEVGPIVARLFAGSGALDVENHFGARVEACGRNVAAGLDQHFEAFITQPLDKGECLFLRQRFAAGYFDEVAAEGVNLGHHCVDRHVLAARESVLAVAPDAAHRAAGQTHERAGPAGMRRLALYGAKYFGNAQHCCKNIIRVSGLCIKAPVIPVESRSREIDSLLNEGAGRLLGRAENNRSLSREILVTRILSAVEKYLLRDDPRTPKDQIRHFIDELQADDLCLIIACERGDEKAWTDLVERFTPTVRSAARSASSNEDAAEDLAQSIWAELYGLRTRNDGRPASKLAYYSGRGSLAGWLRAVVAQLAVDVFRKQSKLVQTEEDAEFDRLAQGVHVADGRPALAGMQNPEESVSTRFAQAEMQQALNKSVQDLNAEDRLLVKLYYFDNLRLREAGAVLGVHEATASRRLTRIQTDLRKRVSEILIGEKGWTKAEAERAFAEVGQQLDTDVEALLNPG